jgi:hypothetical protein
MENNERSAFAQAFIVRGSRVTNHQINFIGWVLFVVSAVGFIIASIGSFWAMFGSVFFLIACIVFMIPFFRRD